MQADQDALWKELYVAELNHRDNINANGQLLINIIALESAAIFFLLNESHQSLIYFEHLFYASCILTMAFVTASAVLVVYGFQTAKTAYINNAQDLADYYRNLQAHDSEKADKTFADFVSTRHKDVAALNAVRNDTRSHIFFVAKTCMIISLGFLLASSWIFLGNQIEWSVFNVCR